MSETCASWMDGPMVGGPFDGRRWCELDPMCNVHGYTRRADSAWQYREQKSAPIPESAAERNQWVLSQMEAWRKALHAASQARSLGAKCRRWAERATLELDRKAAADCQAEAEKHYQRAESLEAEALAIRLAIAERVR